MSDHRQDTDVIHAGEGAVSSAAPITTPIYATSTFTFPSAAALEAFQRGDSDRYIYSRYANPTVQAVEAKIAAAEGGDAALVVSSGMAATSTAFFGLVQPGDEVVCSSAIYGGTLQVLTTFLARFGVRTRFASIDELGHPEALIGPKTKVLWCESPTNPTLRCVDIAAIAAACRAKGVISIVDNTFASPMNQQPLALGADLVMHSATKYLNGHSDVTAGALVGSTALIDRVRPARKLLGGVLEPASAYALARGIKTLAVRMARHNSNAMAVAQWLESHGHAPDARLWRHGVFRGEVRIQRRCVVLRSPGADSASRQPGRRGEPLLPAGADLAIRTVGRPARRCRRHPRHGPLVDRP
jgi:cystathionine beta-lyase/cystathionine gamma-synthase